MRDVESLIGAIERKKEKKQPLLKALCTDTLVACSVLFCGIGRTGVSVNGYIYIQLARFVKLFAFILLLLDFLLQIMLRAET